VEVGDTVSLRVVTSAGPTDVVGTLLAASAEVLTLRRRDGTVAQITVDSIAAGRVVPPGPARTVPTEELERIAARGWRAIETEQLGEWVLRAAGGFTGRANSALAVGDPALPPAAAVDAVQRWYAERALPPRVQLAAGAATPGLTDRLDEAGWSTSPSVHVMTSELTPVLRAGQSADVEVRLDASPDDAWLALCRQDSPDRAGGPLPGVARQVLVNHDTVVFASVRDGDACVAVARAAVDGRWAGLHCVEVAPSHRRQGLGRVVSAAALRWAGSRGGRHCYLQASTDNAAAVALYAGLGFAVHHDYVYRIGNVEK
jgi:GNAT superfamily N-acetyltransferase